MRDLNPAHPKTRVHPPTREWLPASAEGLFAELKALKERAASENHLLLYRGHNRREWRLDSTFVRSVKTKLFGMQPSDGFAARLRDSGDLNSALTSLLLLKFGTLAAPSEELRAAEAQHGLDAWFELAKRFQQYADKDSPTFPGTNFLDWSQSSDVGLYFANYERTEEGALFICDATATGKTQQVIPFIEVLSKVREQFMRGLPNGIPLLFSPPKQIANQRARNQQAVYFAQMELRLDMLESWRLLEEDRQDETIAVKMVLPRESVSEVAKYLADAGIVERFIFPDKGASDASRAEV